MSTDRTSTSVTELEHAGMRFFAVRTGAKDVVTINGSVFGGSNMLPATQVELPDIAAELMDAGTTNKSKEIIRESLGERGASISFGAGGDRFSFSASCFPEDIIFVLKLIVECLSEASFPVSEVKSAKERALGDLKEEKSDTGRLASSALTRMIYDSSHVNYEPSLAARQKSIEAVTRAELLKFRKMLGQGGLVLSVVGDVQPESVLIEAKKIFVQLPTGTQISSPKAPNKKLAHEAAEKIVVSDKANIDVFLGLTLPITYDDPLFLPLVVLLQILGGRGFTSHLMSTIRERDGLTYGVYAWPAGFSDLADGSFRVWATFSPQKYDESVAALKKELTYFFTNCITEERLAARKIEMAGDYLVGLSTSGGLAGALHTIGIEGKKLSYLDEYSESLNAVSLADLKAAAKFIQLDKLALAAAGTFVK